MLWIAKDYSGVMHIFRGDKPKRYKNEWVESPGGNFIEIKEEDYLEFKNLKWTDEPIEITVKKKKK